MTPGQVASVVLCTLLFAAAAYCVWLIRTDTDRNSADIAALCGHLGVAIRDPEPATDDTAPLPGTAHAGSGGRHRATRQEQK